MTDYLLLTFIFLCAGVISVPIAARLGLGSVLGYLLAGIVISPVLGLLQVDVLAIQHFAEFGVVLMLFLVGLELKPDVLWRMRVQLLGLGGLQVLGTTVLVTGVAVVLGQPWKTALAVGLVLSLSSTAIVLQTLNEKGLLRSDGGQASFSVLLFQDIAVIPMLALLPLLATPALVDTIATTATVSGAEDEHGSALSLVAGLEAWQAALATIGAIACVIFFGRKLASPIFRFVATARLQEAFTATALLLVVGVALLMSLVGLSPALGTFLAGVMLAESEYRHEIESDIAPFRGLFLGLFFITVGAGIDFELLRGDLATIVGLTLGLLVVKGFVLLGLAAGFGLRGLSRWLFALGLCQAGEFGFVLLALTVADGVIPAAIADRLLLVIALSMLLTPALFILYDRLIAPAYARHQRRKDDTIDQPCEIIIAGHGRFGGIVNRMLRGLGYETTVIDYSSEQLEMLRKFGIHVYFGDATRPDLLHAAGIERAKLLVVAIDDRDQVTELVRYAVSHFPRLHVLARARDRDHVYELWAHGCRDVIRESYDSSLRAGRSALEALGASQAEAQRLTNEFEALDRQSMVALAELHRLDVPNHENPAYVAKSLEFRAVMERQLKGHREGAPGDGPAAASDAGTQSSEPLSRA